MSGNTLKLSGYLFCRPGHKRKTSPRSMDHSSPGSNFSEPVFLHLLSGLSQFGVQTTGG